MNGDTSEIIRRPSAPEETALHDALSQMLLAAVHARNAAWEKGGYHTLRYWSSSEAGLAVMGDVLVDAMSALLPINTFEDIWNLGMEQDLES